MANLDRVNGATRSSSCLVTSVTSAVATYTMSSSTTASIVAKVVSQYISASAGNGSCSAEAVAYCSAFGTATVSTQASSKIGYCPEVTFVASGSVVKCMVAPTESYSVAVSVLLTGQRINYVVLES